MDHLGEAKDIKKEEVRVHRQQPCDIGWTCISYGATSQVVHHRGLGIRAICVSLHQVVFQTASTKKWNPGNRQDARETV